MTHGRERTQRPKENISNYFHEKVALCKACDLPYRELKEQVAIGLLADKLSNFVLTKSHVDEDELFQDLISYECLYQSRKEKERLEGKLTNSRHNTTGSNRVADRKEGVARRTIWCYNCNEAGHLKTGCLKPVRGKQQN